MDLNKPAINEAASLLDRLLGVQARKPGTAAKLPAVIRVIESLEPAGGLDFPVFPSSYAGAADNDPPVYDLSGIVYGDVQEVIRAKRGTVERPQIISAARCTLDSPQSQANRTEVAFVDDEKLRSLVPQGDASIPREARRNGEESVLRLAHRIADFRVRLSDKRQDVETAISDFAGGNVLGLLQLMPTSIVFGFWDSRGKGTQHKHARILLSRIDAFDIVPCRRHALYSGPYSADEFAAEILDKPTADKAEADAMAKQGFTNAPSEGLGGVLVKGKVERLALISLTDIARLHCRNRAGVEEMATDVADPKKDSEDRKSPGTDLDEVKTNAARRYIFALAALAEAYPRSTGSHRLRSGCELVGTCSPVVELRGGDATYPDADALRSLYTNREMLVDIATQAKVALGIPEKIGPFCISKASLKGELGSESVSVPAQTVGDTASVPVPKSRRGASKKSR
jgi:CRISPR-associated protein Csb1